MESQPVRTHSLLRGWRISVQACCEWLTPTIAIDCLSCAEGRPQPNAYCAAIRMKRRPPQGPQSAGFSGIVLHGRQWYLNLRDDNETVSKLKRDCFNTPSRLRSPWCIGIICRSAHKRPLLKQSAWTVQRRHVAVCAFASLACRSSTRCTSIALRSNC
jgi:hypothetical protein